MTLTTTLPVFARRRSGVFRNFFGYPAGGTAYANPAPTPPGFAAIRPLARVRHRRAVLT